MAAVELVAWMQLRVWSVWVMQGLGFGSEPADNLGSSEATVWNAGVDFRKREQAKGERYLRACTKEQLAALKKHHENEISHHVKEIECLQKEMEEHKQLVKKLKHHDDD
ncbi:ATPase inhibitor, mitochondrial-like [Balaenoptera musculus]|uniref:ATPase inhibitor, mitochondrial n=1 Tax=Balaenoptera musculus TaxID=9771 RepID=A0A8B8Z555_BALMU|nr:ATPase inhibitor, mitochondrial-like [Balaenoptera musculus]